MELYSKTVTLHLWKINLLGFSLPPRHFFFKLKNLSPLTPRPKKKSQWDYSTVKMVPYMLRLFTHFCPCNVGFSVLSANALSLYSKCCSSMQPSDRHHAAPVCSTCVWDAVPGDGHNSTSSPCQANWKLYCSVLRKLPLQSSGKNPHWE